MSAWREDISRVNPFVLPNNSSVDGMLITTNGFLGYAQFYRQELKDFLFEEILVTTCREIGDLI